VTALAEGRLLSQAIATLPSDVGTSRLETSGKTKVGRPDSNTSSSAMSCSAASPFFSGTIVMSRNRASCTSRSEISSGAQRTKL
jgi:hypothetical protein